MSGMDNSERGNLSVAPSVATAVAVPAARRRPLGSARGRVLMGLGVVALGTICFFSGDTWLSILDTVLIAAIASLGLNVLSGYAGQVSLGIAFFMGIGAYTSAWLGGMPPLFPGDPVGLSLPVFIWLPAAGIAAALAGALIGPTALRLKGFYLGIVTLALVFIGYYLFSNVRSITGGAGGRQDFPAPGLGTFSFASPDPIFGIQLTTNQCYFLLLVGLVALASVFVGNVARSRAGRAWQAVRDNEVAASIMGVNLFRAKMGAFVLSSFLAGIAGALYASFSGAAEPGTWSLVLSIEFVAAILIGGVASVWGSILGAAFVFGLQQALFNFMPSESASSSGISSGNLIAIFYGLLIIIFLLFEPAGIIGLIRRSRMLLRRFDARRKGGELTSISPRPEPVSQLDQ